LPNINTPTKGDLNFNKQVLEEGYRSKEQLTQNKLEETKEMISQTKMENQSRRSLITEVVNEKITQADSEIAQGKQGLQSKSELIKQKVKERGSKGSIKSAWDETKDSFNPWHKDDDN
jgi:hypothetical protein